MELVTLSRGSPLGPSPYTVNSSAPGDRLWVGTKIVIGCPGAGAADWTRNRARPPAVTTHRYRENWVSGGTSRDSASQGVPAGTLIVSPAPRDRPANWNAGRARA